MSLVNLIIQSQQFINIQQMVVAQDAAGGQANTWQTVTVNNLTAIPVIIRAPDAATVVAFEQRGVKVNCKVLFYFDVDASLRAMSPSVPVLSDAYRFQEIGTGYIHIIEGTGILNSLIMSATPVYRADTFRRQAPT